MALDGYGTQLYYGTLWANVISVDGMSMSRDVIDAYTMDSPTWQTFIPAEQADPGTLSCELEFDESVTLPAVTGTATALLSISYPGSGTTYWQADAMLTEWSTGATIGERMTANATFRLSGTVSATATSTAA
jgi:hypothetical protein